MYTLNNMLFEKRKCLILGYFKFDGMKYRKILMGSEVIFIYLPFGPKPWQRSQFGQKYFQHEVDTGRATPLSEKDDDNT